MKRSIAFIASLVAFALFTSIGAYCAQIRLKTGIIDTTKPQAAAASASNAVGAGYYLVSLKGSVNDSDKQLLMDAGAEIVEYIPDNSFVIHARHRCVSQIKKLGCVEWVGPFKSGYKFALDLASLQGSGQYLVTLFPGQNADIAFQRAKARKIKSSDHTKNGVYHILADGSQLAELAKSNAVAWIEPFTQPKLCNNAACVVTGIPEVRQNLGLYGSGQIIGTADVGLDTGDLSTIAADFTGRILKTYTIRRPGEWSDLNGHGTHTTGSLLGCGALSGSNPLTHNYNSSLAGVAPEASLVFQSIGDGGQYVFPPLHLGDLFQPAYDDGARVHTNSWGSAASGQYTVYSGEVDQFAWDHKDFTMVYAVGNEAIDANRDGIVDQGSVYAPATAKNCIAVGATENNCTSGGNQSAYGVVWPTYYPAAPINYDPMSNNINGMAAFSGRGPTSDGRIKPDLCAPGTNVISARSHAASNTGWGVYDTNYIYWGGTSMSTPQVAGAAALVREYFQKEKSINPSAALVKAALINGAVDMSPGQYGSDSDQEIFPAPDNVQGWGRLNLKHSLYPGLPTVNDFADASTGLSTGQYMDYQYSVTSSSVPLKVTLVWTDYPGALHAAQELVDDLDLTVTTPTGYVYPVTSEKDHTNNVEQVVIPDPVVGTYTVRVTGYNVPMGPQDYALAVSGAMPSSYIAGKVTTSLGAGVSNAVVAMVVAGSIKRITTNQTGQFLAHVPPGTYSVQVAKSGWTFTPRSQAVTVGSSPVENVNFQGTGTLGSASGSVTSAVGGVVNKIVETSHPYLSNFDQTYVITAHTGATRVRVHFAEIDLMSDGDQILVTDTAGTPVDTYTGKGSDIWSSWVNGNELKVRIITNDYGNVGYGFYIDGYETDLIQQGGVGGVTLTFSPGSFQAVSAATGAFSLVSIPPGTYTITPTKDNWQFQPTLKTIEIPSGGSATGITFLGFPPGSISGEVRTITSTTQNINVESAHPYEDNYTNTWQIDADPSSNRIRLHFQSIITEPGWDYVYLMDGKDNIIEIYTGDNLDFWTPWITGSVARIMLSSDDGNTADGFVCDKYESDVVGPGLPGVAMELSSPGSSVTTSAQGAYAFPEVGVGTHTLKPQLDSWIFDPTASQVSISAGMSEQVTFYVKLADLDSAWSAKKYENNTKFTLRGLTVTAVFNGFFYVQDTQRISGICVVSQEAVEEGNVVDVTGTITTVNGERKIDAETVTIK